MKRMICALLTLIMLLSVMPMAASAAGMATSESAITVLKNLQKYSDQCVQVGSEYRTGYGTICSTCTRNGYAAHSHSEKQADRDLRSKLKEIEGEVNSFASSNGLSLNQNKFDALVLVSYDIGTSWLKGSGVLKSAVVKGLTGNDFLNAIGQSSALGSDSTDKITGEARRMIEGNMYLNGTYSDIRPNNYGWVKYVINDGYTGAVMAEGSNNEYVQYFDSYAAAKPAPVPTRAGYTFMGWYMNDYDRVSWISGLASFQVGANGSKTLYAKWLPNGTPYTAALGTKSTAEDTKLVYNWLAPNAIASKDIVAYPGALTSTGKHTGSRVMIDQDWIDGQGNRWGHLISGVEGGGDGWVLVSGTSSVKTPGVDVIVTVTNSTLNGRAYASASAPQVKTFKQGDKLHIINTTTSNYHIWGQVANEKGEAICWVCLMYTDWNEVSAYERNNTDSTKAIANAVVNCEGYLNVRSEAGTDNAIVGALADGDHVEIYEIKFVNGHQWGRTTQGWIQLTYSKVTMVEGNNASFTNTKDVLAYTFTGVLKKNVTAHTDTLHISELVGNELPAGSTVAVSMIKNGQDGIWGFNGIGWIQLKDIEMDIAKYVVITDGVTVRESFGNDKAAKEKITKGVELNISNLAVVDATIWGYTEKYDGWVNLASKFVQRSNAPVIKNVTGTVESNWVATVVNTDQVNVRAEDSASSTRIGGLSRGTQVRVWFDNNGKGTWYKVDSNHNKIYEVNLDGWISAQYLDVKWSPMSEESDDKDDTASTPAVVETGMGVVANTYSGVNIRTGPGTGHALTGNKYLNGTAVEILEVQATATSKWGRTNQGWVCMDYITMLKTYAIGGAAETTPAAPTGPNAGGSTTTTEGNVTFVSTPASYTGSLKTPVVELKKTADEDAIVVTEMVAGTNVTVQELRKVTTKITAEGGVVTDGNATTENIIVTTSVTYWARINGGWIQNPAMHIALDALEETVYTNVGESEVDVFSAPNGSRVTDIPKGVQVTITSVQIAEDKVWGFAEDIGTAGGWVRLDKLAQGAHTVQQAQPETNTNTNTNTVPTPNGGTNVGGLQMGVGSDTTGMVPTGGYRYTGTIYRTDIVNVRARADRNSPMTIQLKAGAAVVIYETTINANLEAWGRCDAGWVRLYYVNMVPTTGGLSARVVYNDNTPYYSDMNATTIVGTYQKSAVIDIFEIVGKMARTNQGWVNTDNLE